MAKTPGRNYLDGNRWFFAIFGAIPGMVSRLQPAELSEMPG